MKDNVTAAVSYTCNCAQSLYMHTILLLLHCYCTSITSIYMYDYVYDILLYHAPHFLHISDVHVAAQNPDGLYAGCKITMNWIRGK